MYKIVLLILKRSLLKLVYLNVKRDNFNLIILTFVLTKNKQFILSLKFFGLDNGLPRPKCNQLGKLMVCLFLRLDASSLSKKTEVRCEKNISDFI